MSANPIKYTSRTFQTILNDINSDPILKDKPLWWKLIWAGVGDVFSLYQDIIVNEAHLKTAQTKEGVDLSAFLIDYQPTPLATAYGYLYFNLKRTCSGEYSFLTSELIASNKSSLTVSSKKYGARADITYTIPSSLITSDYTTNIFTIVSYFEFYTGYVVRLSTTETLPAPLAIDTDYYLIKIDDTTFKLATSLKNAIDGIAIDITNDGTGNHTITNYTFRVVVYQQEKLNPIVIGKSDGISKWQEFNVPVLKALKDTISIVINGETWIQKESLIDSYENDKHFYVYYKEDNQAVICFGNGVYGKIPAEYDIYCSCYYGGGSLSNISMYNISQYIGSNSNIESIINIEDFTNGEDTETIEDTRRLAPMSLKTNDKFISTSDGINLVLKYGGVSQCKINRNQYGLLTCQVVIIPTGGGTSPEAFKNALANHLINLTILECIDVRVIDATYKSIDLTAGIKLLSGYNYTKISNYVKLAIRLLLSEISYEIKQTFINYGIESAVSKINTKWSTSFDVNDYVQINILLTNLQSNEIGKSFQMSDIQGYVDTFVEGCDYIIISSPSFPITTTSNEITSDGIITLTEIS